MNFSTLGRNRVSSLDADVGACADGEAPPRVPRRFLLDARAVVRRFTVGDARSLRTNRIASIKLQQTVTAISKRILADNFTRKRTRRCRVVTLLCVGVRASRALTDAKQSGVK